MLTAPNYVAKHAFQVVEESFDNIYLQSYESERENLQSTVQLLNIRLNSMNEILKLQETEMSKVSTGLGSLWHCEPQGPVQFYNIPSPPPQTHTHISILFCLAWTFGQLYVHWHVLGILWPLVGTTAYWWTPHPFSWQVKSFLNKMVSAF